MEYLIVMVPALPLLTAIITYLFMTKLQRHAAQVGVYSMLLTFGAAAMLLYFALSGAPQSRCQFQR